MEPDTAPRFEKRLWFPVTYSRASALRHAVPTIKQRMLGQNIPILPNLFNCPRDERVPARVTYYFVTFQ